MPVRERRSNRGGASRFTEPETGPEPTTQEDRMAGEPSTAKSATDPTVPVVAEEVPPFTGTKEEKAVILRDSYTEATTQLRTKYAGEFDELRLAYLRSQGVTDWTPKPTKEQVAADTVVQLALAHGLDLAQLSKLAKEQAEKEASEKGA